MKARVLTTLAAALTAVGLTSAVQAQEPAASYPSKVVRIVVGYQAGGPTDVVARLLGAHLQASLGQPFVVENKPGAASNIASETVAQAPPDGYTLLLAAAPITMSGSLHKDLKWSVQKSFEPVSFVMSAPSVLAVAPNFPAKTLQEIIDLAKKQPGKLTYGSTGHGGTQHLAGEMLKLRAGIDIVHVPYKGAAGVMNDLIAGHIAMAFMTSVSSLPHLQERQVIPVAVAAAKRLPQIPEMPTMGEAGLPGFESDSWNGLFAPAGTPPAIVAKLQAAVAKAVQTQDMRDKLLPQGAVLVGSTPAEFRDIINREVEHWANIFKTIQVKPE